MVIKSGAGFAWCFLFLNGVYLATFGNPTLAHSVNVAAHLVAGIVLIALVAWSWRRISPVILISFALTAILGAVVFIAGGASSHPTLIFGHAAVAFAATLIFAGHQEGRRYLLPATVALMAIPLLYSDKPSVTKNLSSPPVSMDDEAAGKDGSCGLSARFYPRNDPFDNNERRPVHLREGSA